MNRPLTPRQKAIYDYVCAYIERTESSPTLEEIRAEIGVEAVNTVVQHLVALEKKGYITRRKHAKRNIQLRNAEAEAQNRAMVTIPVLASVGCDDLSIFADENHDEFLEVDKTLLPDKGRVVALRAVGTSMNDAGIDDGDYVLVEVTEQANNGDRVVAIIDDMATIKKLERKEDMTILRPESKDPQYKPLILTRDFKIFGKVLLTIPGESMDISQVVPLDRYSNH